jgi:2-polyprenyl-6-methoxyphenol hydroxylase-like FAD-dependent oxidoreductase
MKFAIVGGGPGGLFFAYLLKKARPEHEFTVFEQNPADATYGWGVVFSNVAMSFIKDTDQAFYQRFVADHEGCDYLEIVHRDTHVQLYGNHFSRTSRIRLLETLQGACREVGVELKFGVRIDDSAGLTGFDAVVAADGVNSAVRGAPVAAFTPRITERRNLFAWYGTRQLFHPVSLIFRDTPRGVFIAHAYQYSRDLSTFLIEASPEAWCSAGLDRMSDEESRAFCEQVFARDLGGNRLLSNRSSWFRARIVEAGQWHHGNVVLIGDALRTVHFSLGSGTRMAMQDAVALCDAFRADDDVPRAFAAFERARGDASRQFQDAAARSLDWYETVDRKMGLDPVAFAYDYMRRTGRITDDQLRIRNPTLMAAYDSSRKAPQAAM